MKISIELKQRCVDAFKNGMTSREIYNTIFLQEHSTMSYESFRRKLRLWKNKTFADEITLSAGTYPNFMPHNATVQVNGSGDIVQAWIKQTADDEEQYQELIDTIKENTKPIDVKFTEELAEDRMLEIGLYDMHFGLQNDYSNILNDCINIIKLHTYDEINIVIGQDLLHNDDFKGRTSKGTQIEKINIAKAWEQAKTFYFHIIEKSFSHSKKVNLIYVKGNHDESLSWAFCQMLKEMFPNLCVDDEPKRRKCLFWNGCFIGLTHGCETMSRVNDLRGQFTIKFPNEFAKAKVREIHCGHLHHEKEADVYGVMIRRLSTANIEDEWSDDNGFVGSHKRFMIFEWTPNNLKAIHYIGK